MPEAAGRRSGRAWQPGWWLPRAHATHSWQRGTLVPTLMAATSLKNSSMCLSVASPAAAAAPALAAAGGGAPASKSPRDGPRLAPPCRTGSAAGSNCATCQQWWRQASVTAARLAERRQCQ